MKVKELQEEVKTKKEGWRKHQEEQRLTYEKELWVAEESSRHEQQERDKEARKRKEEWKRAFQEERKVHSQMVKKASTLSSEVSCFYAQRAQRLVVISSFYLKQIFQGLCSSIKKNVHAQSHASESGYWHICAMNI